MQNFLLMGYSTKADELSAAFGFSETLFLNRDFVLLTGNNPKKAVSETVAAKSKGQQVVYSVSSEEMLRFVIEKTAADIILGSEKIFSKDSLHYIRGGLDQISCRLATEHKKTIAFSFEELLISKERWRLLGRMQANIHLCKKYQVKTIFSGFCNNLKHLRSAKDLETLWLLLQQNHRNVYR